MITLRDVIEYIAAIGAGLSFGRAAGLGLFPRMKNVQMNYRRQLQFAALGFVFVIILVIAIESN